MTGSDVWRYGSNGNPSYYIALHLEPEQQNNKSVKRSMSKTDIAASVHGWLYTVINIRQTGAWFTKWNMTFFDHHWRKAGSRDKNNTW